MTARLRCDVIDFACSLPPSNETIDVFCINNFCFENHIKRTNTLFGIYADFLNATTGSTYRPSYHWVFKRLKCTLFCLNLHISCYWENRRAQWRLSTKRQKEKSKRSEKKENWENGETSSLYFHIISVREDTYHPWGNVKSMQNFDSKFSSGEANFMPCFDMTPMFKWFFTNTVWRYTLS